MDGILKVTPTELENASTEFGAINTNIRSITDSMISLINSLKTTWQGEASEAFNTKFMQLEDDMDTIHRMIDEHVRDLNDMAQKYKEAEIANVDTSNQLAGDVIS